MRESNVIKEGNMVSVCHMTSVHSRDDIRIFEKECKSLAAAGYQTTLVVNDREEEETKDGVRIISTGFFTKSRIKRALHTQSVFLKRALELNCEIYHLHDPELLPLALRLKKRGKKVIFDSHEYYYEQIREKGYMAKFLRSLIAAVYLLYERRAFKKIDAVIYPCTIASERTVKREILDKIVYINNVPKLEDLYNHYSPISMEKEFKACYLGSLTRSRGIKHITKAAHKAKVKLILAGKFHSESFEKEVKQLGEAEILDYRGFVDRRGVLDIYKESSVGLCTLLNRGQYLKSNNLPTKAYEYMSMAMPVIISDSPYTRQLLKKYEFGLAVNPEDIEGISKAILELKNNPELARKMGQKGREAVLQELNWGIEERKLLDLYKKLLN